MKLPNTTHLDGRLVIGSVVFGIGWGVAGFCPSSALVGIGMLEPGAAMFVLAMLVGMGVFECVERRERIQARFAAR